MIRKLKIIVIYSTILKGKFEGEEVLTHRNAMISSEMSFEFKLIQLVISFAFNVTINKSQGKKLSVCGQY